MNIFDKVMSDLDAKERRLGLPLRDPVAIDRRMNIMATMTGGKGFRTPRQNEKRGVSKGEKRRRERKEARHGA
jgi:hypothetical protein